MQDYTLNEKCPLYVYGFVLGLTQLLAGDSPLAGCRTVRR